MALNQFGMGILISAKDAASGVFNRVGNNFSGLTKRLSNEASKQEIGMRSAAIGGAMLAGASKISNYLDTATTAAATYQKGLAEVTTLTNEATFASKDMSALIKGNAMEYGTTQEVQTKALYQAISAGYGDVASATAMLGAANNLAIGGVTDVKTAVDGLTNVLNNYKANGESAASVSDAFVTAMKMGKTTVGELGENMGKVAPLAQAMGISMDELFASVATITTKGIGTSEAISGLKASIQGVMKPTAEAAKEAKRLGVDFGVTALKSKGLYGVLDSVTKSSKFNSESFTKLFGSVEGLNAALAIVANGGETMNGVMDAMKKKAGAAKEAYDKMAGTYDLQVKRWASINEIFTTAVGEAWMGIKAPVLEVVNRIAKAFTEFYAALPPEVRQVIVGIVAALGSLIGMVGGIMAFKGAMAFMNISFSSLAITLAQVIILIPILTIGLGGIAIAVYSAYRAFSKNTGGFATSWTDMVAKIKLAYEGAVSLFKGEAFSDSLKKELGKAENQGVVKFLTGVERFLGRLNAFWQGIKVGFEKGVDSLANSSAMKQLQSSMQGLFDMFSADPVEDSADAMARWQSSGETAGTRMAKFGEAALGALNTVIDLGKKAGEWLSGLTVEDIKNGVTTLIALFEDLKSSIIAIGDVLGVVWAIIKPIINALSLITNAGVDLISSSNKESELLDKFTKAQDNVTTIGITKGTTSPEYAQAQAALTEAETNFKLYQDTPTTEKASGSYKAGDRFLNSFGIKSDVLKVKDNSVDRDKNIQGLTEGRAQIVSNIMGNRGAGKDTKDLEALFERTNAMLQELTRTYQKPLKVMIDAEELGSKIQNAKNKDAERDLEPAESMAM